MHNLTGALGVVANIVVLAAVIPIAILASPVFAAMDAYDRAHGVELEY